MTLLAVKIGHRIGQFLPLAALLMAAPAVAHDGPQHVIDALTLQMATHGQSAERLYQRAVEYRTLGDLDRAERDLRAAIAREPGHHAATVELAQVLLAAKQPHAAIEVANRALKRGSTANDQAALRMVRCDALLTTGRAPQALVECQLACQQHPDEVEWLLKRSQIQAQLGRHAERIADLAAAKIRQPGGLVHIEWIDAMLAAGKAQQAFAAIEQELSESRLQSSWLIRRAQARQILGQAAAAEDDLRVAIAEIDGRMHTARPDVTLIADRGLAYALLGQSHLARRDLQAAKSRHAEPWMLWRLERALAASSETSAFTKAR